MPNFFFTTDEIDKHKHNHKLWHNFVRNREAEMVFSLFKNNKFSLALELGAGNGEQSIIISKFCKKLICTELNEESHSSLGKSILDRNLDNVEYKICDAQDLSLFSDNTFDMIYSSNLLEHVLDINKCLKECKRVLKNNGVMLHIMPSRCWKIFYSGINILKKKSPRIHGVSKSNMSELIDFGTSKWADKFESLNLNVNKIIGLPFYVGHGNSFIPIIKIGNLLNLSSLYLYVIKK